MTRTRNIPRAAVAALSVSALLGTALTTMTAAVADPTVTRWTGDVTPIIQDAQRRVASLGAARVNKWFDMAPGTEVELGKAAVNALPSVKSPSSGRDLGRLQVIYSVTWPQKEGVAASMFLRYREGKFRGYQPVDDIFIGSFGFRKPRTDLAWTIKRTQKWVANHPRKVPSGYALESAQLQKADAPPPLTNRLRWVVTYADGPMGRQVLVYMNGKVEYGGEA